MQPDQTHARVVTQSDCEGGAGTKSETLIFKLLNDTKNMGLLSVVVLWPSQIVKIL